MSDVSVPQGFIDLGPEGLGLANNGPLDGPVIDQGVDALLKQLPVVARHSGWEFHGYVWWNGEAFTEVVCQEGQIVCQVEASTLPLLMGAVNNRFRWL